MAEEQMTIASAVIVPEALDQPPSPPPPVTKRRQSSISHSSKRPRLSIDASEDPKDGSERRVSASSDRQAGRPRSGQMEDRKRGQRLFGGLLGTLSQGSSSIAQKRRADIEKKQQVKLKLQTEEYDEKKRQELNQLIARRRIEQKKYDEQSMRIRHSNLLATANYLSTSSQPILYYKPWELLTEENERIKTQIEEAEATVDREVQDFEATRQQDKDQNTEPELVPVESTDEAAPAGDSQIHKDTVGSGEKDNDEVKPSSKDDISTNHEPLPASNGNPKNPTQDVPPQDVPDDGDGGDGGDGGEVVLEAEEDTVIY
ncbi:MAG: hypothetical protein M1837_005002 [Sclerophora amabilis]|nr:MAG: hypothetical protein M1837_005002 [Sclerophora amabilis]